MPEIGHIQLPMSTKEIPLYLAQLDTIVNVIAALERAVASPLTDYDDHPSTLSAEQLSCVVDPRINNKWKLVTSHDHH